MTTYAAYMESGEWAFLTESMKEIANHACEFCGSARGLQTHHISYERLGNERWDDLIVLCSGCHKDVHEFRRFREQLAAFAKRRPWPPPRPYDHDLGVEALGE